MKYKLILNNLITLIYQIVSILIGLFLPRFFLNAYGSDVNGLVSSITQMLSIISLLDFGIGAVVQSSLYKPLSKKNFESISNIYCAAQKYFKLIARILIFYIIALVIYFGFIKDTGFSNMYTITLILSISLSSFAQYYFGICNSLLLNADQKLYITNITNLITIILNAIFTIILIKLGANIQCVKLFSSIIFILRPLIYTIYVKKHYHIKNVKNPSKDCIQQKWHGLAQHISSVVTNSTDYVVLTIFSTLKNVSIYNIYVMPLNSIKTLMESLSASYKSFFGKLYAENKINALKKEFRNYELVTHYISVILFSCICKVLVPFVLLYTSGIKDANYANYIFSYLITLAYAIYSLRIPYTTIIFAAGHFKETQLYCVIESLLNIILSVIFVIKYGLVGVAIGTCVGVGYRLCASAFYLKKSIINRRYSVFLKNIFIDFLAFILILIATSFLKLEEITIIGWIIYSVLNFIICIVVTSIIYMIFYPSFITKFIRRRN
ncbi:polysaccharide biosynthesis C-terminal domain-containing protein [Massilimicrobiota timonensis]|uniref:Uncharacterized protein n=1 Tax=Massilimicrobiota timonensis TaxID=1776392 RepID=A0A1Y4SUM1_9FIRM|nr:polysaccharide biosynthesis C-terminal domain-containing protein [Massilimicrobiota timonensis]OUQ33615.1 hypothetical protein B5E75_09430 [Massilimicrobiota timonensis]